MTGDGIDVEVELEPIELGDIKGPGDDQAQLVTFRGRNNRVLLGKPRVSDYLADLHATGSDVPDDLAQLAASGYTVLRIRPTISLLPGRDCIFTDVDFSVELVSTSATERPLAYEVRPAELTEEIPFVHTEKTIQELGGEAGAAAGKLIAKITREKALEGQGSHHLRHLYSYGTSFYEAGWRLQATHASALQGNVADLELIVQVPPKADLFGRFRIAAEIAVQVAPDRWLTRSFGPRRGKTALDVVYPLSP